LIIKPTGAGKGFSRSNLFNMRMFYFNYPNVQTLSGHLTWSHYCELITVSDIDKRSFYQIESERNNWSIRELQRQIETSLFERLVLSQGAKNKEIVAQLATKGNELNKPEDFIKQPFVLEFLSLPENKPLKEKDLESKLIRHIEMFLLELGKGFMFVGSQQRITLNNTNYYVDMVFYNKILKAYILIDLKRRKLKPADSGQMNMYLNYYKTEINDSDDNLPIGIILCTEKDSIAAEYILSGLDNQIFAGQYTLCIPNKEKLIAEVKLLTYSRAFSAFFVNRSANLKHCARKIHFLVNVHLCIVTPQKKQRRLPFSLIKVKKKGLKKLKVC